MSEVKKKKKDYPSIGVIVSHELKEVVNEIAKEEDRSTSQTVRRLLEESPKVQARLRERQQQAA